MATSDGLWSQCRQLHLPLAIGGGCAAVSGAVVMVYVHASAWSVTSDRAQVLAPASCLRPWDHAAVGADVQVIADAATKFLVVPDWCVLVLAVLVPGSTVLLTTEEGLLSCVTFVSFLASSSLVEVGLTATFAGNQFVQLSWLHAAFDGYDSLATAGMYTSRGRQVPDTVQRAHVVQLARAPSTSQPSDLVIGAMYLVVDAQEWYSAVEPTVVQPEADPVVVKRSDGVMVGCACSDLFAYDVLLDGVQRDTLAGLSMSLEAIGIRDDYQAIARLGRSRRTPYQDGQSESQFRDSADCLMTSLSGFLRPARCLDVDTVQMYCTVVTVSSSTLFVWDARLADLPVLEFASMMLPFAGSPVETAVAEKAESVLQQMSALSSRSVRSDVFFSHQVTGKLTDDCWAAVTGLEAWSVKALDMGFTDLHSVFNLLQKVLDAFIAVAFNFDNSLRWSPSHIIDLLLLKFTARESSVLHVSKLDAVVSEPSGTAVDSYDQLIKLLRSLHKKRCDFMLPFAVNIQVSLGLLQAIWHKCAIKFDTAVKDGGPLLAFSSLADVFYLSTIWYNNRTKEVDAVSFVKATRQSGVTAAQLAAGDAELMEKLLDCIAASGGSRLTYPFSLYRPFHFWEQSHIDMLSSRGLLSKSIPKPSDQLQLLYGAPIVVFKPIQVEGLDVPSARLPDAFFGPLIRMGLTESADPFQ